MNSTKKAPPAAIIIGIFIIIALFVVSNVSDGFSIFPIFIIGIIAYSTFKAQKKSQGAQGTTTTPPPYQSKNDAKPTYSTKSNSKPVIKKESLSLPEAIHKSNQEEYKICQNCGYKVKHSVIRCPICNTIIRNVDHHADLR